MLLVHVHPRKVAERWIACVYREHLTDGAHLNARGRGGGDYHPSNVGSHNSNADAAWSAAESQIVTEKHVTMMYSFINMPLTRGGGLVRRLGDLFQDLQRPVLLVRHFRSVSRVFSVRFGSLSLVFRTAPRRRRPHCHDRRQVTSLRNPPLLVISRSFLREIAVWLQPLAAVSTRVRFDA